MRICPQCSTRFSEPVSFCPHDGTPTREEHEASAPADPYLGRVIDGRYRVEAKLGEGGMGVVYRISHAVLGKRMALKVLRGDMARDPDVVQRFVQEAQSATQIGHPNIVDISDFGQMPDGSAYFVMEYLEGGSLTKLIAQGGSIPAQAALHIIRQIASALGAAHDHQIVHRDLKPDNVSIVQQGADELFVKVLDFGIAKVGGASSKLTKTGMIFGTPHYMSPEQASGQAVDRRTDIYALGIIMYEMFVGHVPFDGDTFMGILSKHMFEEPISPSRARGVSLGAVEDVILKAIAKRPEARFQTMAELGAALDALDVQGPLPLGSGITPPTNLADMLEPPSRTEMNLGRASQEPVLPTRSRAPLYLFLGAAAIALVSVGGYLLAGWVRGQEAEEAATSPGGALAPIAAATPATTHPPTLVDASASTTPTTTSPPGGTPVEPPTTPSTNAPEHVDPPPVADTRATTLSSDPPGADVLLDGMVIGQTPLRVPIPEEGERAVTLRLRGYRDARLALLPTSPDTLETTLEAQSARHGEGEPSATSMETSMRGRQSGEASPPPTGPSATTTPETPPAMTSMTRTPSEIADPWE